MSPRLKTFLQYVAIIIAMVFLLWFSLRGITPQNGENKTDFLLDTWHKANKGWLMIMAVFAMVSHVLRALRWKMLLMPTGYHVKFSRSFLSLMIGYLVNLVIPRGGELTRCYNLYALEKTPVEISFGTVVTERIVDLLCLVLLLIAAFTLESGKLLKFMETLPIGEGMQSNRILLLLALLAVGTIMALTAYWLIRRSAKLMDFIKRTWAGIKTGLLSVFQLKQKGLFIFYSLSIWLLYFLMSYAVLQAFPSTSHLGFSAVMSLFGIGAIAMAAPLPGGTGSYHVLVPQSLIFLYSVERADAVAFTFIFHGWQTIIMIVGGSISLLISFLIKKSAAR